MDTRDQAANGRNVVDRIHRNRDILSHVCIVTGLDVFRGNNIDLPQRIAFTIESLRLQWVIAFALGERNKPTRVADQGSVVEQGGGVSSKVLTVQQLEVLQVQILECQRGRGVVVGIFIDISRFDTVFINSHSVTRYCKVCSD